MIKSKTWIWTGLVLVCDLAHDENKLNVGFRESSEYGKFSTVENFR